MAGFTSRKETTAGADVAQTHYCTGCGAPTPWETMSRLGARCELCYAAYCARPRPAPHLPQVPSAQNPKAWAWALRERELAGARLSRVQREMWRAAIGREVGE
jgi:hypothetical protein